MVSGVKHVVNVATETLDFVDSMYAGVKKLSKRRCAPHDYQCKLEVLYDHWDDPRFDAAEFVEKFLNNQFEDYVYGKLGQRVAMVNRDMGFLDQTGFGSVLSDANKAIREADEKLGNEPGSMLPSLEISEDGKSLEFHWPAAGW